MAGLKMTGRQYNMLCDAEWGPDWYWDDTVFMHNGVEVYDIGTAKLTDEIILKEGTIHCGYEPGAERLDALVFARAWFKKNNTISVVVEMPKDIRFEFEDSIRHLKGVKIL